jgi:hypothetical protein
MVTWAEFESAAPDLAAEGRRLIYSRGDGEGLLATVRDDLPPRIHPINVAIVDRLLYAFILRSPKRLDLEHDGRFVLHTQQDPAAPSEFSVRGRAHLVEEDAVRSAVAAAWYFGVDETYHLFEFSIEAALLEARAPGEWPTFHHWTPAG